MDDWSKVSSMEDEDWDSWSLGTTTTTSFSVVDDVSRFEVDDGNFVSLATKTYLEAASGAFFQAPKRRDVPRASKKKQEEDEVKDDDDDVVTVPRRRHPKSLVKGGLARRIGPKTEDSIQVVWRPSEKGVLRTTALDEAFPDLLRGSATLGRHRRWETVRTLLDDLESWGLAECLGKPPNASLERGAWAPTTEVERYVLTATGETRGQVVKKKSFFSVVFKHESRRGFVPMYDLDVEPRDDTIRGVLRGVKHCLSKRERRAFAPGAAAKCGAASVGRSPKAVVNGVCQRAIELDFAGRQVFVEHVGLAGKIHDTVIEYDDDDGVTDVAYRDNRLVETRRGRKSMHVAISGTDAWTTRVEILARPNRSMDWVKVGDYAACENGHQESFVSLADSPMSVVRDDGKRGVPCVALRFKALEWHRAPVLRVGAYGVDVPKAGKRRSSLNSERDDQSHIVIYDVCVTPPANNHDDDDDLGRSAERRAVFRTHAHKPRRTSGFDYWYRGRDTRAALRKHVRRDINDALPL
eukprot:CAMPEP_0197423242 /NCGR_PEP_ID=MMETSP1170-20131217/20322_1 /TAXON_ID=54406 /ORGANISM="Sarcinochrysis sp, Strain CCMP770" /LENGTH=522 /DNA_ID=CAMNT_0042950643 /DNA_START=39 /DNA_END=1607 /DNA_ORIENTATION=+